MRRKGLKDLNVYRRATATPRKGLEDLNVPLARAFFVCLNQDEQDEQDFQDGAAQAYGRKVR